MKIPAALLARALLWALAEWRDAAAIVGNSAAGRGGR